MANSMNFVDEVYNILKTNSFQRYSTQNILNNNNKLANVLSIDDRYIKSILNYLGTYLNIPLKDGYFMNIINVGADGNCGLYAALVGLYLKDKNTYNSFITGKKNRGNTPHMYVRKEIVKLLDEGTDEEQKKIKINQIKNNKNWVGNEELLLNLPKIFFDTPVKIFSLNGIKLTASAVVFKNFVQDYSLKEEDIIILNTGRHFKLIKIRKGCYTGDGFPVSNSSNDNGGGGKKNNGKLNNSSSKLNKNAVNRHRSTNNPLNRFRGNNANTGRRSNADGNASTGSRSNNANTGRRSNANGNASTGSRSNNANTGRRSNVNGNATPGSRSNNANTGSRSNSNGNASTGSRSNNATPVSRNSSNANNINRRLPCVICGGSKFVYVSKVGKRKLRYTKTGRKYVISNGKRKYLK